MRLVRAAAFVVSATALLATSAVQAAEMGATDEPITLALHEWTGQHITTFIAGGVLEKMGYKVEYVTASYLGAGAAIADGDIAASLEVWDNNLGEFYPKLLGEGKLEDIGETGIDGMEGWMYPSHMTENCPGLPAWNAFKSCAKEFATAETYPKGRFLEYPADWGDRSAKMIKAENLDYTAIPAGSEGAMVAEIKASLETKAPLIIAFWKPHWILLNIDVGWVDIPHETLVKGSMTKARIFKVVWPGIKDKWPAAYELLKSLKVTNGIQEPLMGSIDSEGKDARTEIKSWIDANEAVWKPWVDAAM
jgi:glycine betaine/proline transport system substrate-binding protein